MVLCSIRDEQRLTAELIRLTDLGFDCFPFYEGDLNGSLTAVAVGPVTGENRTYFRSYQLLKLPEEPMELFESKWGFHALDRDTYLKLKRLNHFCQLTLCAIGNDWRWTRKAPKNRVIRKWLRNEKGQRVGHIVEGPRPKPEACPVLATLSGNKWTAKNELGAIMETYKEVRHPKTPTKVKPVRMTKKQINDLYCKVVTWFSRNKMDAEKPMD